MYLDLEAQSNKQTLYDERVLQCVNYPVHNKSKKRYKKEELEILFWCKNDPKGEARTPDKESIICNYLCWLLEDIKRNGHGSRFTKKVDISTNRLPYLFLVNPGHIYRFLEQIRI